MSTAKKSLSAVLRSFGACSESVAWAESYGSDHARAWAECPRGDWMLWIAARSRADRLLVGLSVCDCVESALIYTTDPRPAASVATLRAYLYGEASRNEVRRALHDADAADASAVYAASAAFAAAEFSDYASDSNYVYAASAAACAAHYAASAGPSRREALARFADLVRARVPRPEIS